MLTEAKVATMVLLTGTVLLRGRPMTDSNDQPNLPPVRHAAPGGTPPVRPAASNAPTAATSPEPNAVTTPAPKRRRGLGIPILAVLFLAAVIGGGWFALSLQKNQAEAAATKKIQALGGLTTKDGTQKHIGTLNLSPTTRMVKSKADFDAIMASVSDLHYLGVLNLSKSEVTSEQLAGISGLKKLTTLQLSGTATSDSDLDNFTGMANLEALFLKGTKVSSRGLSELASMKKLAMIDLSDTDLEDLTPLANLATLKWLLIKRDTPFSDADVDAIGSIPNLGRLTVNPGQLTKEQTAMLKKALPTLSVE